MLRADYGYQKMVDHLEIVAICDPRPEAAESAAARVGARAYTSLRRLVGEEKLDLCDAVTPGDSHHAVSCFLSACSISHIVETPIAATLPLADLIMASGR